MKRDKDGEVELVRERAEAELTTASSANAERAAPPEAVRRSIEPPVVARLIVEIRSDGSRTIARGALEDVANGQRTQLEARGDSPLSLALQLARALAQLPRLGARSAVRGLLGRRRDRDR